MKKKVISEHIKDMITAYEATGRIVTVHPLKGTISLNGFAPVSYQEAYGKMKDCIGKEESFVQLLKDQEIIKGKERHLIELWEASKLLYPHLEREGGNWQGFDEFEEALLNLATNL